MHQITGVFEPSFCTVWSDGFKQGPQKIIEFTLSARSLSAQVAFELAPQQFNRVQIRRVRRQELPKAALSFHQLARQGAFVSAEIVYSVSQIECNIKA